MTPKEAINIIEDVTWQDNGRHYGKIAPAREIAISALEKQIPKKPKYIEGDYDMTLCPCCGMLIDENEEENYCSVCGQALDWGDCE